MNQNYQIDEILQILCPPRTDGQSQQNTCALTQFMDQMPGGFLIYHAGQDDQIIYANRGLLRIFQCETEEEFRSFCGNSFRLLIHPDDRDRVEKSIRDQICQGENGMDYVEYRTVRRDGVVRWIEDYGHFTRSDALGDIFYVFLSDATEKRELLMQEKNRILQEGVEKELRLQRLIEAYDKERSLINVRYLRQLEVIEGLSVNYDTICYVDLELDQILPYRLSPRTAQLLIKDEATLYSDFYPRYVELWVHPEDRNAVLKATAPAYIRDRLRDAQTFYFNFRVLLDSELRYLQLRIVNVGRQEGTVSQVVLGFRSVDEEIRRQMEQQALLSETLARANLAINSKNAFLSNISHDMRTPLHAIFGFTSLAKMSLHVPDEAMEYLDRVEKAGQQLLEMIEKVLEASALSGDESESLKEVECDLRETAQRVCDFLQPQALEKHITFTLDCSGLCHQAVYADQEKLRQMLLNLANNAITYTDPGGAVSLSVVEGDELGSGYTPYRFIVQDNGIGISPEFLEIIYEPFNREKNSTLSGVHGIGLGLTIVKCIVDMMGGTLDVQSALNAGSTFTVSLSFRRQPPEDTILMNRLKEIQECSAINPSKDAPRP
ncbi:MAG: PAS domain-containing sensor histidine kinase [Oscillospiraceae bacterium]|nr:PAS domain-containing sensor histidine kinase [Oscillospiraceae bacterium]